MSLNVYLGVLTFDEFLGAFIRMQQGENFVFFFFLFLETDLTVGVLL